MPRIRWPPYFRRQRRFLCGRNYERRATKAGPRAREYIQGRVQIRLYIGALRFNSPSANRRRPLALAPRSRPRLAAPGSRLFFRSCAASITPGPLFGGSLRLLLPVVQTLRPHRSLDLPQTCTNLSARCSARRKSRDSSDSGW